MSGATGIAAAVAGATVPTAIREEGAEAVQAFHAALSFESMLLKEMLSEALPESPAGSSGEEEGGEGSAFTATLTPVSLPETVAEAVVGAGGLGLATEMYPSFEGVAR